MSENAQYVVINDDNFVKEVIQSPIPVLVDFWAPWCAPCRMIGPVVEALAGDYAGKAKIGKINVDESQQVAAQFGISSIPTLLIFKGGKVVDQLTGGNLPKKTIAAKLDAQL